MFCSFNCYLLLILGSFLHLGTVIIHLPRTQRKQVSNRLIVGIAAFIVPECSATTYLMYLGPRFSLSSCLALCACVNIVVLAGMLHVAATTEPLGLRVATFVDFKTWKVCTCRQHKKMLNITPGVNFKDMVLPTDQTELEVITPEGSPHSTILRVQCSSTRSLLTVLVCMHWLGDSLWSLHIDDISKYAVSQLIQCRDLMQSLTQPVLFANSKKEITFANDSMRALLGFACNADAIGTPVDSLFSPPPFDCHGDGSITWQPSRVNTEGESLDIQVSVNTLQVRDTTMHSLMAKDVRPHRTHVRPANLLTSAEHRIFRKSDDHGDANDVIVHTARTHCARCTHALCTLHTRTVHAARTHCARCTHALCTLHARIVHAARTCAHCAHARTVHTARTHCAHCTHCARCTQALCTLHTRIVHTAGTHCRPHCAHCTHTL